MNLEGKDYDLHKLDYYIKGHDDIQYKSFVALKTIAQNLIEIKYLLKGESEE